MNCSFFFKILGVSYVSGIHEYITTDTGLHFEASRKELPLGGPRPTTSMRVAQSYSPTASCCASGYGSNPGCPSFFTPTSLLLMDIHPTPKKKKSPCFSRSSHAYWPITKSHRTGGGATSKASKSWSLCIVSCRTSLISCRPMTCQGLEMPWKSGIELGKITMLGNQIESQIWDFIPY